ncbi:cyclic AMP receptor-like protein [Acrasis kona]|uniref:Cyclic AMP receptor-like protein n=1 Tax=Acrasis kona TaxID=1008807 RepID=A0AAW2ZP66_9EUKA
MIAVGSSSIVSCFGSLFIIFSYLVFKSELKVLTARLIVYLSFADLLASSSYLIRFSKLDESGPWCLIEATFMCTFELCSVLWSSCICVHLLLNVLFANKGKWLKWSELIYHIISWGLPLIWTITLFFNHRFGQATNWCWLKSDEDVQSFGWRFFTFLPIYCCMFFNLTVYVVVLVALRRLLSNKQMSVIFSNAGRRRELRALLAFSFVMLAFFITWIPPFFNRMWETIHRRESEIFWLNMTQAITNPLQGFMNMVLYGYRFLPQYKRLICPDVRDCFLTCCSCCCCSKVMSSSLESPYLDESSEQYTNHSHDPLIRAPRDSAQFNLSGVSYFEPDPSTIKHVVTSLDSDNAARSSSPTSSENRGVVLPSRNNGMSSNQQPIYRHGSDSASNPDLDQNSLLDSMYQATSASTPNRFSWGQTHHPSNSHDGGVRIMYHHDRQLSGVGSGSIRFQKLYGSSSPNFPPKKSDKGMASDTDDEF